MLKSEETNTRDSDKEDFLEEKACSLNRRRKQEKSLEKNLELVRRYLPLRVAERLTNLKRFYCGRWNLGFKGLWDGKKEVFVRIPREENLASFANEVRFLQDREEILFYHEGVVIREWIEGEDLTDCELSFEEQLRLLKDLEGWYQRNKEQQRSLLRFDWYTAFISDPSYYDNLELVRDEPLVVSHGDLNPKNIIRRKDGSFEFIDTEWVRLNTRYFDLVSLHLEVGIDRELLIGYFKLEKDRFDTFIRLYNTFIDSWLTSVELREGVDYYLKGSEERFFLEKSNSITQRGLTKDNFDKLRFENFFPEILSEDENFWILRWQQRLPWKPFEFQKRLPAILRSIFDRLQTLDLKLISFRCELNSLEASSSSVVVLEALSPYIEDIYQIIDRLSERPEIVTLPTLSLRSLYQDNNTIKLLELDRLVMGHPALHWASLSEFANLGSNFKRDFVKGLLEIFGEELVAAQVAVLYHNLLLQASRGKILALEWTLPRLIRKVRIASNKLKR